jgi:phosphoribosyl-ATP pyrophosphohydrolase
MADGQDNPRSVDGETMAPLVLVDHDGNVVGAALTSGKGYRKSLEQGVLWAVDARTGRLLPFRGGIRFSELRQQEEYYEAVVEPATPATPATSAPADPSDGSAAQEPSPSDAGSTDSAAAAANAGGTGGASEHGDVLARLERLIAVRKEELPEGSYTTHLFSEGEEKIRKKTGEEAVELLLAGDAERMVSESADLLYHLLVLFAAREISVTRLLDELERRLEH